MRDASILSKEPHLRGAAQSGPWTVPWVGLALLVGACGGEPDWRPVAAPTPFPPPGAWVGYAVDTPQPEVRTRYAPRLARKVHIFEGRTLGYELTFQAPATYRLRWTTDNLANHTGVRRFTGSVATSGHFLSFAPGCDDGSCDLEEGDHVSGVQILAGGGERIDWDTLAKDGWDGFSFTTDGAPLYVDTNVDGKPRPDILQVVNWNQPVTVPVAASAPAPLTSER